MIFGQNFSSSWRFRLALHSYILISLVLSSALSFAKGPFTSQEIIPALSLLNSPSVIPQGCEPYLKDQVSEEAQESFQQWLHQEHSTQNFNSDHLKVIEKIRFLLPSLSVLFESRNSDDLTIEAHSLRVMNNFENQAKH